MSILRRVVNRLMHVILRLKTGFGYVIRSFLFCECWRELAMTKYYEGILSADWPFGRAVLALF